MRVPITVTGVAPTDGSRTFLSEPTLYVPTPPRTSAYQLSQSEPLRDLHIAAGADKEIGLLWRAQGTCSHWAAMQAGGGHLSVPVDSVRLSYSVLGVLHETQTVVMSPNQPTDGSPGYPVHRLCTADGSVSRRLPDNPLALSNWATQTTERCRWLRQVGGYEMVEVFVAAVTNE